jgi:hypothetical protein
MKSKALIFLWLEFIVLFGGLPLLILFLKNRMVMIALLWGASVAIYLWLRYRQKKSFLEEWNWQGFKDHVKPVMIRFLILVPFMFGFMYITNPDKLFSFPLERFDRWVMVMLLYPLLSVVPQELIYKTLFFGRYAKLFGAGAAPLIASAVAFGFMHVMLGNIIAVAGTTVVGYLIGQSYLKSRSLALASFEHALYGCWIYTLGLGIYFYTGAAWGQQ